MNALESVTIQCPYCGHSNELTVEPTTDEQRYIEDCQVCCQPISVRVSLSEDGEVIVFAESENP